MIHRRVSAVFLLRDGFSGRALSSGAQVRCTLDGAPARPVWKNGGYLVFTDLSPGKHELAVGQTCYQPDRRVFTVQEDGVWEDTVELKPGDGYPLPAQAAVLELTVTEGRAPSAQPVWLGMSGPVALKLARASGEDAALRLFCRNAALLPVPGYFLIPEQAGGELVHIRAIREETGELDQPLLRGHPRGTELIPMQRYTPDGTGRLRALFPRAGTVWVYCQGAARNLELAPGGQALNWDWKEGI